MYIESYKLKINKPLFVILVVSMLVTLAAVSYLLYSSVHKRKIMRVSNYENIFKKHVKAKSKVLDSIIELMKKEKSLQELFLDKNRDNLYNSIKPVFEDLNKNINITHLYFLDENGKTFLRVHNPAYHSDMIDRLTFKEAYKTGKSFSGLEFGVKKNFTLRNVHPWNIDGKIIGYIELGVEIDQIMTSIANIVNAEVYAAISKEVYNSLGNSNNPKELYETDNYFIVYKTENIPKEIGYALDNNPSTELHLNKDKKHYHTFSLPIFDFSNKNIGYYVFLLDGTFEKSLFNTNVIIAVMYLVAIVSILFLTFNRMGSKREKEINSMADKLISLAITDELTKLYNRKHFNESIPIQINSAKRLDMSMTMIMFDVDNFKKYNDTYGHQEGDKALQAIAKIVESTFKRSSDTCFRIGGEEFAIIIMHQASDDLYKRAESFRKAIVDLNIEHKKNDNIGVLSVSIGMITCHCDTPYNMETLYKMADEALYRAKDKGRNCTEVSQIN